MWLERTNLTTSYPLPGIVGWYPVVATETVSTVSLLLAALLPSCYHITGKPDLEDHPGHLASFKQGGPVSRFHLHEIMKGNVPDKKVVLKEVVLA